MKRFKVRKIRRGYFLTVLLSRPGKWLICELRRLIVPLSVFLVICGLLIFISSNAFLWQNWKLTSGIQEPFCEQVRDGSVKQPLNSWSSLAFVPFGLWAIQTTLQNRINSPRVSPVRRHRRIGLVYGMSLIFLGIGSWLFHASLTYVGHFADVMGMYFLGGFLFTYGLSRKFRQSATAFTILYAVIVFPLVAIQWFHPSLSRTAFAALIVSALSIELIIHKSWRNWKFIGALISLALAYGVWLLDEKNVLCWPESCVQGHAIWHVLTALAAHLSFHYYLSEAPRFNLKISYRPGRYNLHYKLAKN